MSTATTAASAPASAAVRPRPAHFADVVRSEWTKLRTVRSTFFSLLAAVVLGIGLSVLISAVAAHNYTGRLSGRQVQWDPTRLSTAGLGIAQLAIAVLGIMVVTSEYSSGMIRTSLAAVPRRGWLLGAKSVVYTAVALVVGEIIAFVAFFSGQAVISGLAPTANLGQPGVLRAVAGSGLYLAALGLLAVAVAALVRQAAAGIAILVALLFELPGVANALPTSWRQPVEEYWPTNAGQDLTNVVRATHSLGPWAGFGVMCLFVAIVVVTAFVLIERRDA